MKKKEINSLTSDRIKENLKSFENGMSYAKDEGRHPLARYASFDYCFNYFQGFKDKKQIAHKNNIQNSCLHLAFYLASWGMLRGSSFLLQKSIKFYEPLIIYISKKDMDFWKIDVSDYSDKVKIERLIECSNDIKKILNNNSDILITKIMLGVFGNVPAFDSYFKIGSNLGTFNRHELEEIFDFYDKYSKIISDEVARVKTFEYHSGEAGNRSYTKAKIIDMIFFIEGYKSSQKK